MRVGDRRTKVVCRFPCNCIGCDHEKLTSGFLSGSERHHRHLCLRLLLHEPTHDQAAACHGLPVDFVARSNHRAVSVVLFVETWQSVALSVSRWLGPPTFAISSQVCGGQGRVGVDERRRLDSGWQGWKKGDRLEVSRSAVVRARREREARKRTMSDRTYTPGPMPNTVRGEDGNVLTVPTGWVLLPPGDAALTRRVKAAGDHWVVAEKKGRKLFSRGIWAMSATIERIRGELEAERSTESFAKRKTADAKRRDQAQAQYVGDFKEAVVSFLGFHPRYAKLAERLARAVANHATPVGSGTVARTKRIPIEQRAEAAVIAWMRHETTGYDKMEIPRIRGKRRQVRREMAQRSQELLDRYRRGAELSEQCPLWVAVGGRDTEADSEVG